MARVTRRGLLAASAGLAAGAATTRLLTGDGLRAADAVALERFEGQKALDSTQRILLKGGTIVSLDDTVGNLVRGDILIEGKSISAIGPELKVDDAQVIAADGCIVIPGLVDAHRHAWEGQLRRINPDAPTRADYWNGSHLSFALHYRPQDMYLGNLITALGCIDAGITCIIDNSHNSRSAAHSDAAIQALFDSGIRAVHASGAPMVGTWGHQWPQDLVRLQKQYFASSDQLVTLRMFSAPMKENWELARRLGLRVSTEFFGEMDARLLDDLWDQKLVGPDNTFNHCGALPARTWRIFAESGATIDVTPRSDAQYALGEGVCALQHAIDHGIRPGLSVDNETSYGTDLFTEMRVALYLQRAVAQNRRYSGDKDAPRAITVREIFECGTLHGANCAGLLDKVGSLRPGKQADMVVVRADGIDLYPSNNALGTVVQAAHPGDVDTVIIGGRVRKFRGTVVGLDMARLRRMTEESLAYLFLATGYTPDPFAESLPKLS